MKKILITGSAGFIGFHLSKFLLDTKNTVIGIDSISNYYDVKLKNSRLNILKKNKNFYFYKMRLESAKELKKIIKLNKPEIVIHLAAQAGVRYSIENPKSYIDSNIIGTFNLLDILKSENIKHLLMASTSSIYGSNTKFPFSEIQKTDNQLSIYAATKKSTENLAHSYSYTFGIPITMLRFFTVYGPWGRPDMALFKFTKNIIQERPIDVFNHGMMIRDFTYVDDIVKSITLLINKAPNKNSKKIIKNDSMSKDANYRVVNIGNSKKIKLIDFIKSIENNIKKKAVINLMDMQLGDVPKTHSDTKLLYNLTGFSPSTSIDIGIDEFIKWYKRYYKLT
tara:strand:+ start:2573 stop:3583 length:1011 start_codon:yes stop_codon:yes gene_type:complete